MSERKKDGALAALMERLGSPLRWSDPDKALLLGGIMLAATLTFFLLVTFADGWPYFPLSADPEVLSAVAKIGLGLSAPWAALVLAGIALRRRVRRSRGIVIATVLLFAITTALFAFQTGPTNSVGWIVFIGGTMVGFLLFPHRWVLLGIVTWFGTLALVSYLAEIGAMHFLQLVRSSASGRDLSGWSIRIAVASVVMSTVTLWLSGTIIRSWRDREKLLEEMSKTDALTGVNNRRHVMTILSHELRQAKRYQRSLSCVMVDLDHFKRVNDVHGHLVGDQVLVNAAEAIRRSLRDSDVVGRYGGEEFLLLLPNTDLDGAREVAERCRKLVSETALITSDGKVSVTASMGIASYPSEKIDGVDTLVRAADAALYRAKQSGRDRVEAATA